MPYSIMLDAGHGGRDPGAVYEGRQEKDDTLQLTLAIGEILQNHDIDVEYTRTTDIYESPYEKAMEANNAGVDFFVSIHRNSYPTDNTVSGVETLVYDKSGIKLKMAEDINEQLEAIGDVYKRQVHDYTKRIPVTPGEIREYVIEINPIGMVFPAGSAIELEIKAMDNFEPQSGAWQAKMDHLGPIPSANTINYKIYRDKDYPSYILMPYIPETPGAVSYTHLDVYKRQPQSHSVVRRTSDGNHWLFWKALPHTLLLHLTQTQKDPDSVSRRSDRMPVPDPSL